MLWFKHYTDAHAGTSIRKLKDEFGYFGPFAYWTLVELCAGKLEKGAKQVVTEDDCEFSFHVTTVTGALFCKAPTVQRLLVFGESINLWTFVFDKRELIIKMPKLVECLDRDQKRPRRDRVPPRQESESELELNPEIEKEKERGNSTDSLSENFLLLEKGECQKDKQDLLTSCLAALEAWLGEKPDPFWKRMLPKILESDFESDHEKFVAFLAGKDSKIGNPQPRYREFVLKSSLGLVIPATGAGKRVEQ